MGMIGGTRVLPVTTRKLFIHEFEKDLKFFQLFFLLINKSCPIRKIDLVWAEDGPAGRVGLRLMGTADALNSPCAKLLVEAEGATPDPCFCNIVNDYGRREAESCAISDRAAQQRVRKTRAAEIYRCHAGLVDIAVPVICDDRHIATLLTGQVLPEPPSAGEFVQIREQVRHLEYVDLDALEKAYYQVPVVSAEDIRKTVEVLELFAEYLANSWTRLSHVVREQRRAGMEWQLLRKEFAHAVLDGTVMDRAEIRELMRRVGLSFYPNRVLVVKLESEEEYATPKASFDLAFTAAVHAIEDTCESEYAMSAYLQKKGVCVFLHEAENSPFTARTLANRILNAIQDRCDIRARIGIGRTKQHWQSLPDSYDEACLALAASGTAVAMYQSVPRPEQDIDRQLEELSRAIGERRFREARSMLMSIPPAVTSYAGENGDALAKHRAFLSTVLESICLAVHRLGADAGILAEIRAGAEAGFDSASGMFAVREVFLRHAEIILAEANRLYRGKREKTVAHVCRAVDRQLADGATAHSISTQDIAAALHMSQAHLGRVFRKAAGMTLERFIMVRRVELARRFLLRPDSTIAGVATRCGFSDPTYFSRVFRKLAGCSPSEYAADPQKWAGHSEKAEVV